MSPYRLIFVLACCLVLAPAAAAQRKVWTNEDLGALRARGGISILHPETPATAAATGGEELTAKGARKPYVPQEKDPQWYREQLAPLQAELAAQEEQIRSLRQWRASGKTAQGGITLGQDNLRLTPENEIEQLRAESYETRERIGAMEDLARRHDIAPGLIRVS